MVEQQLFSHMNDLASGRRALGDDDDDGSSGGGGDGDDRSNDGGPGGREDNDNGEGSSSGAVRRVLRKVGSTISGPVKSLRALGKRKETDPV